MAVAREDEVGAKGRVNIVEIVAVCQKDPEGVAVGGVELGGNLGGSFLIGVAVGILDPRKDEGVVPPRKGHEFVAQADVTRALIDELGASDKPCLFVYNKCDKGLASHPMTPTADNVYISAVTGEGTDELVRRLEELATAGKKEYIFEIPSDKFALINTLYSEASVLETEYTEKGVRVSAVCDKKTAGKLSKYIACS